MIDAASEKKKRVAGKEQQCNELQTSLEVAEKELANLRADVAGLKQEHDTLTQRSNELRATVRNQERAQLNAKQISEERCTLERELNALENGRCNIEQQANSVELQISEQARVNAALSEQYEQAAIEAQLIPSDARFACGRDFEMKLTYSNVVCIAFANLNLAFVCRLFEVESCKPKVSRFLFDLYFPSKHSVLHFCFQRKFRSFMLNWLRETSTDLKHLEENLHFFHKISKIGEVLRENPKS